MSAFTYGRIVVVVLAALTLAACPAKKQKQAGIYVNAATGSDTALGTQSAPLKTITRAMRMAKSGVTVNVAPGLYDLQNNETFPISVPGGVLLIGDEANKGGGSTPTRIVGGALALGLNGTVTATLSPGEGSTVAGFTITNNDGSPTERSGVALTSNTVTLRNNTVTGATHSVGVYVGASTSHVIRGNRIVNNQGSGLGFVGGGAGSKVENNFIRGNGYGVKYQVAGGDLGNGPAQSAGGNEIACNTQNDLEVVASAPITISAAGNSWDHSSPTLGCSAGSDICDPNNTATIVATPATQASSNCGSVTLYVDVTTGQDTNPGTQAQPFQTITKATSVATSGATVQVAPGPYDVAETFPIFVPAGVLLIGDEANKGGGTSIVGSGPVAGSPGVSVAVVPGAGSTIAGFTITNNNNAPGARGVILASNTVTLRNNTIAGATHQYGVYVGASTNHVIAGNRIVDNGGAGAGVGLGFIDGGAGSKVENNVITGNGFGVEYDVAGGDLGGGPAGSAGGNVISCNAALDLVALASAPITINAANNLWDHTRSPSTPTSSCNFTGDDICDFNDGMANAATIIALPGAQTNPPGPSACP